MALDEGNMKTYRIYKLIALVWLTVFSLTAKAADVTTEIKAASFAIKENGVKITELVSSRIENRAVGKFAIEIDGIKAGSFNSASGDFYASYQDGDDITSRRRPGRPKYGNLKITRDWSATKEFLQWYEAQLNNTATRKSVSIVFVNDAGEEKRINLFECYPTKWTGPALNAKNSGHASETIEILYERFEVK
jgi:phage tail-like protein